MIRSGFKVKARTVYGGRNFCSHTLSLAVTVICLHGNVLYFVPMFCIVSVTMPCRVGEGVCVYVLAQQFTMYSIQHNSNRNIAKKHSSCLH